jgi:hypothetical protein
MNIFRPFQCVVVPFFEIGEFHLGGFLEVFIGQPGIDDLVAVVGENGRFDASWDRLPAVEEEDFHGGKSSVLFVLPI